MRDFLRNLRTSIVADAGYYVICEGWSRPRAYLAALFWHAVWLLRGMPTDHDDPDENWRT